MPVKISICDDSDSDILQLNAALLSYDSSFEIEIYKDGEALISEIMDTGDGVDILFLDIYMPGLNGIEVAQKIREINKNIKIIFLTSSKDYYPQAYEVFAYNYLVKPVELNRLYSVLDHAIDEIRKADGYKLVIQYKSVTYNIDTRIIRYIESRDKILFFSLNDGRMLQCYGKLDNMAKKLPESYFLRCHQSFIVNLLHVSEMGENYFRAGKDLINISRRYKKDAKERYYAFIFSQMGGR